MSRRRRIQRWAAPVGVLVLAMLLHGRPLMSALWTNAGMLVLRDALVVQVDPGPGTYPVHGALRGDAVAVQALQYLRRAVALNGDNLAARWELGRAALAVGDVETADPALRSIAGGVGDNPLLYHDVLMALSFNQQPREVTALYESTPPVQRTQAISDAVALAYLDLVTGKQGYQGTRGQVGITHWLEQAHALRPGDLYVNYHLWQQAREAGDAEAAAAYGEALTHFYLEAIYPVDERLLHHAAEVVPALIEEGLWDRGQALNVVSFLVWQHDRAAGVERLIERLAERYPAEPEWPFYLAELYHRRGDLERARVAYQQVLAAHPEYAQAVLRLGMVAEARFQTLDPKPQDQLETAASWYGQYHDIAPDDLLGLKRLVDTCTALGEAGAEGGSCPEVTLQEALEARVDGRRVAAQMLGVPVEQVKLGPNLVDNGWFAEGKEGQLERWYFRAYLGPTREGLYFAGLDSLAGEGNSARIIGLRGGPMADGTVTYGECTGEELTLFPGSRYLISARYRSMNLDGNGLLFLGEYFKPDGVRLTHTYLEGSSGEWREVFILVQGQDRKISVVPLIRNWGLGSVWFDDVQVRAIGLPEMTDPGADEKGQQ